MTNSVTFVLDFVRQLASGRYERRELIRVRHDHQTYLEQAAEKFNTALRADSIAVVFNAALLWSYFHEATVLDWQPISARLVDELSFEHRASREKTTANRAHPRIHLGTRSQLLKSSS